jgi:hypothetical protein
MSEAGFRYRQRRALSPAKALAYAGLVFVGGAIVGNAQTEHHVREIPVSYRTGAICRDGSRSLATGRGACSWHGGVARWVHSISEPYTVRPTLLAEFEATLWWSGSGALLFALFAAVQSLKRSAAAIESTRPSRPRPVLPSSQEATDPPSSCPRCGRQLVRRRRRRDGRPFLGCSGYPGCRFIRDAGPPVSTL